MMRTPARRLAFLGFTASSAAALLSPTISELVEVGSLNHTACAEGQK